MHLTFYFEQNRYYYYRVSSLFLFLLRRCVFMFMNDIVCGSLLVVSYFIYVNFPLEG